MPTVENVANVQFKNRLSKRAQRKFRQGNARPAPAVDVAEPRAVSAIKRSAPFTRPAPQSPVPRASSVVPSLLVLEPKALEPHEISLPASVTSSRASSVIVTQPSILQSIWGAVCGSLRRARGSVSTLFGKARAFVTDLLGAPVRAFVVRRTPTDGIK